MPFTGQYFNRKLILHIQGIHIHLPVRYSGPNCFVLSLISTKAEVGGALPAELLAEQIYFALSLGFGF